MKSIAGRILGLFAPPRRCACGCGQPLTNTDKRRTHLVGHYEASPAGKAAQAKGGRNGRGDAKRRDQAGRRKQRAA